VIRFQPVTWRGIQTFPFSAERSALLFFACRAEKIRRGAARIVDIPLKTAKRGKNAGFPYKALF
jgi:hypothetical protein